MLYASCFMNLSTPITKLSQVGSVYQKKLKKLGINTIKDLIFHFPHRYEDFSKVIPISKIKIGEKVCLRGKIIGIENTKTWRKRMILTEALLRDKTGVIKVIWFNQPYLIRTIKKGNKVCLAGKIALGQDGLYLSSPAYEKVDQKQDYELIHTGRIVPVYPETEGLSSRWLRFVIKPALIKIRDQILELLPEKIIKRYKLLTRKEAVWQIHFPDSINLAKKAKKRFSFEALFLISLLVLKERLRINQEKAISIPLNLELIQKFVKKLPFKLTNAQKKSAWQITKDLEKKRPMNRLLEGDVGSGKTIVAIMATLNTTMAGYQTAVMAPTEILAKQHFQEFTKFLKNFDLAIGFLTGKENKISSKGEISNISRKKFLEKIANETIHILIGTHALIQEKVKFGSPVGGLALVILDEQHRFGVEQRARLCQGSGGQARLIPHLLSMTATPIPRTLALTIYGDLDLSLIDQLPKGRKKIITKIISPTRRQKSYAFVKAQVKKGRQVFVICPRIEPGDKRQETREKKEILSWAEVKTVKEEYEKLSKKVFPNLKIGMLHGKMKTEKKEEIMRKFKEGEIDILVSTSVIEVGIDIPNATLMIIEGAERFGLAQLHQFRGRVGRGKLQSYCFLFTESGAKKTRQRLKALLSARNSFELAEKDLKIRGPGDFIGKRQWGIPDLAMDSFSDIFLVESARKAAREILGEDQKLLKYPLLREELRQFSQKVHLE